MQANSKPNIQTVLHTNLYERGFMKKMNNFLKLLYTSLVTIQIRLVGVIVGLLKFQVDLPNRYFDNNTITIVTMRIW